MEFDRRVQIRTGQEGTDKRGFGSGYLIAPHLVLTASHVLVDLIAAHPTPLTVTRPEAGKQEFPAIVRWRRQDETVDAALLEVADTHAWQIPESLRDVLNRPPQRFGLLVGTRPHPVTLSGFPRMQKTASGGQRLDEQLTGTIAPGSGALAGRYEISSTDPTLTVTDGPGSRWSGISGAAVLTNDGFGGDLLCGVVRRDRQAVGGTRLTAVPAAHLLADKTFCKLLSEFTGWEPVLEPIEPASLLNPAVCDRDLNSPAALLRADAEAVTFHGRDSELTDLRSWCQDHSSTVALRVLTGPGGQGKTRLARRLTDHLSRHGWVTGHLRPDLTDHDAPPDFTALTTALPLLLVVDYAETRPRLVRRLVTSLHRSRHRVRLLLLARSDGEWRTDPLNAVPAVRGLLKAAPVTDLAPLISRHQPAQDRRAAFSRAAHDFARLLPSVPTVPHHDWGALASSLHPPDDLTHPRYDNALTMQLTALVALLQHGPRPAETRPGTAAEEVLLEHEGRFWEDSAEAPAFKLNLRTPTLAASVAVAVLCGATAKDAASSVLQSVPDLTSDKRAGTAAWLASLYPAEPDRYWGSLQPDRIAEYHASRTLLEGGIPLPALLAAAGPGQQAQIITVLARAAIARYNAQRITDAEQVLQALDTALEGSSIAYEAVRSAVAALPHPASILAPLALRLNVVLTFSDQRRAYDNPKAHAIDLAQSLTHLGVRLGQMGRRREAVIMTEQAVEIRRRLVADNPAVHEPDLVVSLINLGAELGDVGRRHEALLAAKDAVEICRRLAVGTPATFDHELAASLSNLSMTLAAVGSHGEALAAEQEAVEIFRRLKTDNPVHQDRLASSLSNLGVRLGETGHRKEALIAAEESVRIRRRLTVDNPAAYEPSLASSLSNLGLQLHGVGHCGKALVVEQEAVEIRRRLVADNPAAYDPDLARSLSNLGIRLAQLDRGYEAVSAGQEAVEIYRRLAAETPAAYEPDLAHALFALGGQLGCVLRHRDALTAIEEAVEIYRRRAAVEPSAFEPDLAFSLSAMAALLAMGGDLLDALRLTGMAIDLYRGHVSRMPSLLPQLHVTLGLQAQILEHLGRHGEAYTIRLWLRSHPLPSDLAVNLPFQF